VGTDHAVAVRVEQLLGRYGPDELHRICRARMPRLQCFGWTHRLTGECQFAIGLGLRSDSIPADFEGR